MSDNEREEKAKNEVSLALGGKCTVDKVNLDSKEGVVKMTLIIPHMHYTTRALLKDMIGRDDIVTLTHISFNGTELYKENYELRTKLKALERIQRELRGLSKVIKDMVPEQIEEEYEA